MSARCPTAMLPPVVDQTKHKDAIHKSKYAACDHRFTWDQQPYGLLLRHAIDEHIDFSDVFLSVQHFTRKELALS